MHKSRLGGFIIDCQTDDLEAATGFWSAALGLQVTASAASELKYRALATAADEVHLEVQIVEHPSRVHLDIGARRIGPVETWYVMEAPTGQRFCVVRVLRADFATRANTWDD